MASDRRLAFGYVAELYDRVRPSYPAELIEDVISFARLGPAGGALEVGAGTGKATVLFASRGVAVHALEPRAPLAAIARRNCAPYANVPIEETDFERWSALEGPVRAGVSAQAWHWVAPEVRYAKAHAALKAGGAPALFWNRVTWRESPLRSELREAYARAAPDFGPGPAPCTPRASRGRNPGATGPPTSIPSTTSGEPSNGCTSGLPRTRRPAIWSCSPRTRTTSCCPSRSAMRSREAVREVIELGGGSIEIPYVSQLWLTRATCPAPPATASSGIR